MNVVVYLEKTGLKIGKIDSNGKVTGDSLFVQSVERIVKNHKIALDTEENRINVAKIAGGSYSIVRKE